jgi:hypothetical protein
MIAGLNYNQVINLTRYAIKVPCWAGGGVAKNLWVSLPEQTTEKKLRWGTVKLSGSRNMEYTQSYVIRVCSVRKEKAGQGCAGRFLHIFCHPAARPTGGYTELVGQV